MSVLKAVNKIEERLQIQSLQAPTPIVASKVGGDVVKGLTQTPKALPPCYFYDDRGSELFERICELPEYYLTRTETAILQKYAAEIAQITGACELVELGSGNSAKTRILLDAYQQLDSPLHYLPIDVCAGILESSAKQLLQEYPSLEVYALAGTYESALAQLTAKKLASRMMCFIGSTLGNLNLQECDVFLSQISTSLEVGEYFLLGIDLQKPKEILEPAYNDSQGVTAAFNLNMLEHLNRRFEGNFDLTQFAHRAFYNETEQQIEMHLKSERSQTVQLKSLNLTINFAPGETILTEISRKFNLETIQKQLTAKGLVPIQTWTDTNQWFGLLLCQLQA
ncbi:L-histidine N(alpha)-methyltransferase [Anabaena subtropica]|uniref:L-histidine N(Alpha)-methyltransferase n=1 Tax=Anabaena subtropica FACHB-260 TaxID=2692884 RepID=A0ABR8CPY1_9NOST|nr:L-histidine N(alpha)-methyltransferase [Anabaena subtropica]MBD2345256.1 L-histidine N(alpha)-methyltransferase [Anabaena subtropica FACHB-260]